MSNIMIEYHKGNEIKLIKYIDLLNSRQLFINLYGEDVYNDIKALESKYGDLMQHLKAATLGANPKQFHCVKFLPENSEIITQFNIEEVK